MSVAAAPSPERPRGVAARAARGRVRCGLGVARRRRGTGRHVLGGGALVLGALVANEDRAPPPPPRRRDNHGHRRRELGDPPANTTATPSSHRIDIQRMPLLAAAPPLRPRSALLAGSPRAPGALLLLLEGRAPLEFFAFFAALPWLTRLPPGDGHPVMVLPGMGAGDAHHASLRPFLAILVTSPFAWNQGFNFGPRPGVLERCADGAGRGRGHGAPVSLSAGAWAASTRASSPRFFRPSALCRHARHAVHRPPEGDQRVANLRVAEPKGRMPPKMAEICARRRRCRRRRSIVRDGIASCGCSLNDAGPHAENIEVPASHVGMGLNPLALFAIADRLARHRPRARFDVSGAWRWFLRTARPMRGDGGLTQARRRFRCRSRPTASRLEVDDLGLPRGRTAPAGDGPGIHCSVARRIRRDAGRERLLRDPPHNCDIGLSENFEHADVNLATTRFAICSGSASAALHACRHGRRRDRRPRCARHRAVHVCGASMGGMIAQRMAALRPSVSSA